MITKRALKSEKGIALLEVLLSVVIFSAGIMIVFRPLLISIDALQLAEERLVANRVISNQLWSFQETAARMKSIAGSSLHEVVTEGGRAFDLGISYYPMDFKKKLYSADAVLTWQHGADKRSIRRAIYVQVP